MIIHTLGPAGTSSYDAALELFPKSSIKLAANFDALFGELEASRKIGFVPVENSLHGSVDEVIDLLVASDLKIWKTFDVSIHYAFGALDLKKVTKIASHPQAIAQCRSYLKKHYPNAEHFPVSSTAFAIELGLKDTTIGVIAREATMRARRLPVIAPEIQRKGNATRFAIVAAKDPFPKDMRTHMSIALHPLPTEDRPGLLHQLLTPFKIYDINLTRIENRPTGKRLGDYIFFLDFIGNPKDMRMKKALQELASLATVQILGEW